MRNIAILAVTAITITVLAFSLLREYVLSEQPQVFQLKTRPTAVVEIQENIKNLASLLERNQQAYQENMKKTLSLQDRLNKSLAYMETRLQSLEAAAVAPTRVDVAVQDVEHVSDTTVSNIYSERTEEQSASEADFGYWMDETLRTEKWDRDTTELTIEQTQESLAKLPGVYLADMKCADGFCRATFDHENGEQWEISELFGEPPFVNEGFSIYQPDGHVVLYFAQPGKSLQNLRMEAQKAEEW